MSIHNIVTKFTVSVGGSLVDNSRGIYPFYPSSLLNFSKNVITFVNMTSFTYRICWREGFIKYWLNGWFSRINSSATSQTEVTSVEKVG